MNMIKNIYLLFFIFFYSINCYSGNNSCKDIYYDCFNNIPKKVIAFKKELEKIGFVNTDEINIRDIPLVSSKNSSIIKKVEKNEMVQIKKVFYLKPNTSIKLRLLNSDNYETVNNYRFGKWYLVSYGKLEGFIFSDFITIKENSDSAFTRYRHIDSIDWTHNKTDLQKNVEIIFTQIKDNTYNLNGYAWHYLNGFSQIRHVFENNIFSKKNISKTGIKIFLFDENEIYLESENDIFTGIYKKY